MQCPPQFRHSWDELICCLLIAFCVINHHTTTISTPSSSLNLWPPTFLLVLEMDHHHSVHENVRVCVCVCVCVCVRAWILWHYTSWKLILWLTPQRKCRKMLNNFPCVTYFVFENSWSPSKSISMYIFHTNPQFSINQSRPRNINGNRYKKH